ncbi:hypothetical protein GOP47_0020157 [Adiantum capillus-veneris]|uniref:Transcription factor CBF/NF-Y/archaeal histone domain-containing protein n=1 Tax=Adiantum capillus-veneris TaxID=13818 RepID=A0A9D4UCY0_ADICA|nr:hypothetical protein GOP47_0020157 [Adiantum capillus-veneris]
MVWFAHVAATGGPTQLAAQIKPPPAAANQAPLPLAYQHLHQQQLRHFWTSQTEEIEHVNDFKSHQLPLARIKKIMKTDEDVRMISAEAPVVFAKACELFILELTLRSWMNTEENKRRMLQKNDIASAITRTDIFDFLVDIVPRDEMKEEAVGLPQARLPLDALADGMHYGGVYYTHQPAVLAGRQGHLSQGITDSPSMIVPQPIAPMDSAMCTSQPRPSMPCDVQRPMKQIFEAAL